MTPISLSLMANKIATQDGRDTDATAYLHRQFRNCLNMGLLTACDYQGHGKTATALFDESGLCAARLYSVLMDLGFDVKLLRVAHNLMTRDLLKVIEATANGDDWNFELTMKRDRSTGKPEIIGGFRETGKPIDAKAAKVLAAQDSVHGKVPQAIVSIPASALFRPLLEN